MVEAVQGAAQVAVSRREAVVVVRAQLQEGQGAYVGWVARGETELAGRTQVH